MLICKTSTKPKLSIFCHYHNNYQSCQFKEITGRQCHFLHKRSPKCKFGVACNRRKCMYQHDVRCTSLAASTNTTTISLATSTVTTFSLATSTTCLAVNTTTEKPAAILARLREADNIEGALILYFRNVYPC